MWCKRLLVFGFFWGFCFFFYFRREFKKRDGMRWMHIFYSAIPR